jgi:monoamine oxidase
MLAVHTIDDRCLKPRAQETDMLEEQYDVIVVGAGLAGLTAV